MAKARWFIDRDDPEGVVERIVVTGKLILETPAHFGNGDVSALTDMPLLRDSLQGRALLPGTTIAGALRSYLREYEQGYSYQSSNAQNDTSSSRADELFGYLRHNSEEEQIAGYASLLVVADALGDRPQTELRDGVSIDPKTRTVKTDPANKGMLYNIELLQPGTTFPLCFELAIPQGKNREQLVESLAVALRGLEAGEIGLGKRKRRGFGRCRAGHWQVYRYNLSRSQDLLDWLERPLEPQPATENGEKITNLLTSVSLADKRSYFNLDALFILNGSSLLIRSEFGESNAPDTVHLHSNGLPVLSGTSLAGALRARALRIAKTLNISTSEKFIGEIFGDDGRTTESSTLTASRLIVHETQIKEGVERVQNRIKIDRFTGGAYPGALFSEQPVFGTPQTEVKICLSLLQPQDAEIGLLLMLLKDLWTGDLPLGGEASVGRGRLTGRWADLIYKNGDQIQTWRLEQDEEKLITETETIQALQKYAAALQEKIQ